MAAHVSADFQAHLEAHRAEVTHPFLLDVVCDRLVRWTAPGLLLLGLADEREPAPSGRRMK